MPVLDKKITAPSGVDILPRLLAAREARAYLQRFFIGNVRWTGFVLQISLNIPGWPKRLDGDEAAIAAGEAAIRSALPVRPFANVFLRDAAGLAALMAFRDLRGGGVEPDVKNVKKISAEIERRETWGRALDIDVVTGRGPLSRSSVGLEPRRCLLCSEDAKICARMGRHRMDDLREMAGRLISSARLR
ncbi:MAG: citrate lyase holo-[acyl-carrier protein] synthase [Synergistaceae bacterium]|jgi:holo-ACP synthase CitX|nr:citrate lyase holo-[acyl-carrier protein] synthase [Synergistaceae bacterium]